MSPSTKPADFVASVPGDAAFDESELDAALAVARAACDRARQEILPRFRHVAVDRKSDGSPVTEADLAAERAIRETIEAATYTASPARYDGATNVRGITPKSGPVDGKGGVVWIELTSAVNNPDPSKLAEDFLEYVQTPEASKAVAFTEGTYNPVSQMGDPAVMALFDEEELDAIQMDSLADEMSRSLDYQVVASYDALIEIYAQARRS